MGGIVNDLDLCGMSEKAQRCTKKKATDLHGTTINQEPIELLGGLGSGVGLSEDDRGDTTARAVLVVGEHHLLDGACRLDEVFLERKTISILA